MPRINRQTMTVLNPYMQSLITAYLFVLHTRNSSEKFESIQSMIFEIVTTFMVLPGRIQQFLSIDLYTGFENPEMFLDPCRENLQIHSRTNCVQVVLRHIAPSSDLARVRQRLWLLSQTTTLVYNRCWCFPPNVATFHCLGPKSFQQTWTTRHENVILWRPVFIPVDVLPACRFLAARH